VNSTVDEATVWLAVEQLGKSNLLEECELRSTGRVRLSRRDLIRRLGQGATLALPLVTSIIAPSAARAASCGPSNNTTKLNPVGCPCNTNPACANSCCGFGNICAATGSVPDGNSCRVNCECASGNCVDPAGPALGTCQP
jgi:hypothetical protein